MSIGKSLLDGLDQATYIHRLDQDLIGLPEDGLRSSAHLRERTEQNCYRFSIGMAHGTHYRESISCTRHMEVAQEHVEYSRTYQFQSCRHGGRGGDFEALLLQQRTQDKKGNLVVIDQQEPDECHRIT
jgi:hypothetical protein